MEVDIQQLFFYLEKSQYVIEFLISNLYRLYFKYVFTEFDGFV